MTENELVIHFVKHMITWSMNCVEQTVTDDEPLSIQGQLIDNSVPIVLRIISILGINEEIKNALL